MDYKYHLERILNAYQTVDQYEQAIREARKDLFLHYSREDIEHIEKNMAEYAALSALEMVKKIRQDYGRTLSESRWLYFEVKWTR